MTTLFQFVPNSSSHRFVISPQFHCSNLLFCLSSYVGESEKNLHNLFKNAAYGKPAIIFFDEIGTYIAEHTVHVN